MRELKLSEKQLRTEMSPYMIRRVMFMVSLEGEAQRAHQDKSSNSKMTTGTGRGNTLADMLIREEQKAATE